MVVPHPHRGGGEAALTGEGEAKEISDIVKSERKIVQANQKIKIPL